MSNSLLTTIKKYGVLLPPLSGYTDVAFRTLLAKCNVPIMCTEMVNARAVVEKNKKTEGLLRRVEDSRFVEGVQLVGHDTKIMGKAAKIVEEYGFDYIDVNMGCTVRKVVRKGEGVALMKDPALAASIVEEICTEVTVPVSVKMRSGFDDMTRNAVEVAKSCVEHGACLVSVHGRSGQHRFQGDCSVDSIKEVVDAIDVPVIGNGGIRCGFDAVKLMQKTCCDAVMPGRWLIGNPWCFEEISCFLNNKKYCSPSLEQRKQLCKSHILLCIDFFGQKEAILLMRRIFFKYFPNCANSIYLKQKLHKTDAVEELISLLDSIECIGDSIYFKKP